MFQLRFQIVEEQRVDDTVDVTDGSVVHASLTAFVTAQRLLHQGTEDDRADVTPVELLTDQQ